VKIEKKLITCSILAVTIGIASILPLAFFMSARAETIDRPWFNLNVPYAYWTANVTEYDNGSIAYSISHLMVLNYTLDIDVKSESVDSRLEYYEMQIYSDTESIANVTYFLGGNLTGSVDPSEFHFERNNWFDSNTTAGGSFWLNPPHSGQQPLCQVGGKMYGWTMSDNASNRTVFQRIANIQNSDQIFVDVRRLGWVTFSGNSTVVTLSSNKVLQHIELTKFGDGFLYNTLIPEDQLPQLDPESPFRYLAQQNP
jgi:hypothetical protein